MSMGGRAEGLACADPGARTPIGLSRFFLLIFLTLTFSFLLPSDRIHVGANIFDNDVGPKDPHHVILGGHFFSGHLSVLMNKINIYLSIFNLSFFASDSV